MASNRSIRPIVIMGFSVIFVTFGVFGGWAAVAKLDAAVVAPGTISLEGNRKVVQHLEGGIVDEILVKEGDVVQEGQPVLRLNSIENESNLKVFSYRNDVARIVEARLLAERYLKDTFELPEELRGTDLEAKGLQETVDDQRGLFEDRRMILQSQTEILNSRIEQTNEQIRGLKQQKSALERRYENFGQMIDRMEEGVEKGLIQNNILAQRQDDYIQIEADLGQIISEIAQAKNTISETKLQALQVGQEYRERANTELDAVRSELSELQERVKVATEVLSRTEIVAPATGSVQNLQVHTVSSVIRPGDVLMEVVPADEELIFTARISPIDIDNVVIGLSTEVRFSAFKARLTPIVLGEVENVSHDVITPDNPNEMPYYLARIDIDPSDISEDIRERITAGMPVDVVITTGERTVVNYLTSPLMDAVRKSLLEE
ncbi:HlyD family type I secretion periplasmic adaptor subunit [Sulfitobacter mediterraneus]|uniref:HlyD family type I secretion periplasmic adaptor subunit n=1 Tax=Sulfitobacter mediterraneus TaxID=83219 RepID=UPI0024928EB7|nr:HlyD family type I secretion periplasmic adaptor subunit [Sulfitobacter mediterraneus]